ncbi:MAG: glycosyltransferase family 2 protein [Acidimicrobiia bacterium]|nr:glycosyltransferase family 2 protein [Acidimicrobiia bacterium]
MTMTTACPDLSLVTVSTNEAHLVRECFASVQRNKGDLQVEHILVDNVCTDGSADVARAENPEVVVIRTPQRMGFAPNSNLGLRAATGRFVGLLNPDTITHAGALQRLVTTLEENPDIGLVGPRLLNFDGSVQLSVRRFPNLSSFLVRRTPLRSLARNGRWDRRHLNSDFDHMRTQDVDWMLGAALVTRREAVDEVGILDEGLPLYVDDIDWCLRMHKRAWRVVYVADAEISHIHQAVSDKKLLSRNTWLHMRSMAHFTRTHGMRQVILGGRPAA